MTIREFLDEVEAYYREDYQADNAVILQDRFSKTLNYAAMIPAILRKANLAKDERLAKLLLIHKPTVAKAIASVEVHLVKEIEGARSVINHAHRTLQSQISALKMEMYMNSQNNSTRD